MELKFRKLKANEILCRPQSVVLNDKGEVKVNILLYKDARVDMNLLDEVVKPMNWKREHSRDNANCIVSIWDAEKCQWISKEDTGTESKTEAEKGLASDSFKRACVNWGIGRELYSAPKIWITLNKGEYYITKNGKNEQVASMYNYITFHVTAIDYKDNDIILLSIADRNNTVRYNLGGVASGKNAPQAPKPQPTPAPQPETKEPHRIIAAIEGIPDAAKTEVVKAAIQQCKTMEEVRELYLAIDGYSKDLYELVQPTFTAKKNALAPKTPQVINPKTL